MKPIKMERSEFKRLQRNMEVNDTVKINGTHYSSGHSAPTIVKHLLRQGKARILTDRQGNQHIVIDNKHKDDICATLNALEQADKT